MANTIHRPNRPMTNKMRSPTGHIARYGHPTIGSMAKPDSLRFGRNQQLTSQ
ncbi:MAG TPA: hypothetical protein V6D28_03320 [Leptolyngbyaceae cyanobacterium]